MKIYEMTATFGKLNHETLTLQPGLNIIEAPNEWGKSTWCAFLISMLYGVDTRAKTTKTALADKEHYAPWSGQPMSGRIKLSWQGRNITIERSTKGRVPMGEFSAYETETGIPVPELTGDNCGEMLLGVEQSVFCRSGFLRLSDLPVTRDDALCRRLNALVTTGDESGDGERLARDLKVLKNKCRYNRTGLLPQAEEDLRRVSSAIGEFEELQNQAQSLSYQLRAQEGELKNLHNHLAHLKNQEATADAKLVSEAEAKRDEALKNAEKLREDCQKIPSDQVLQKKLAQLQKLSQDMDQLLEEERSLKKLDPPAQMPTAFGDVQQKDAVSAAQADRKTYERLQINFTVVWILAAVCCVAAAVLCFALSYKLAGMLFLLLVVGFLVGARIYVQYREDSLLNLTEKYGDENPENWVETARFYEKSAVSCEKKASPVSMARMSFNARLEKLKAEQMNLCGNKTVSETIEKLQRIIAYRENLSQAEKELQQAESHLSTVQAMAQKAVSPAEEDLLTDSEEETKRKIGETEDRHRQLLSRLGKVQGRMEALGTASQLQEKRLALQKRIQDLNIYYDALCIALTNLEETTVELQRKFAPRIVRRAQDLMWRMTGGRYEKLTLEDDFSLNTGAEAENILRSALWRSEGTIDQLYLSLRLAVAEELTPEAPLVLDDALVRFDEKRLKKALEILREEDRQILLFTCQGREGEILPRAVTLKV